jgi:hypothetical protein
MKKSDDSDQEKNQDNVLHFNNHAKPQTRRDFMARGALGLGVSITLPHFGLNLLGKEAYAQALQCEADVFQEGVPYLCIDGAGGSNYVGGNVMVGYVPDGSQLDYSVNGIYSTIDYVKNGLRADEHPSLSNQTDNSFGLIFHKNSPMLAGLKSVLDLFPDVAACVDGFMICYRSNDDSNANILNTAHAAQKMGAQGQLASVIGTMNTANGGRSATSPLVYNPKYKAVPVANFNDAASLVQAGVISGPNYFNGVSARLDFFTQQLQVLAQVKTDKLAINQPKKDKINCNYFQASEVFKNFTASALGPDAQITSVFGAGANLQQTAAVHKLIMNSYAGAATINIGGCDYHNGTNLTGYNKDFEIGQQIGKAILYASQVGKDLFMHIFTDGSVVGDAGGTLDPVNGKIIWVSDSGERGAGLVFVYKHLHHLISNFSNQFVPGTNTPMPANHFGERNKGIVKFKNNGISCRQLGHFLRGGGASLTPIFANNLDLVWRIVIANYAVFSSATEAEGLSKFNAQFDFPGGIENYIVLNAAA